MSYSGSAGGGIGGVSPASTPQVAAVPGTKILLCKSGVKDKKPDPAGAEYGEVFVNYHSGSPMLCFKDNAGEIVEIKPTRNIDGGGGETPPSTGNEVGDTLWDGTHFRVWDGSSWVAIGPNDLAYVQKVDGGTITNSAGSDVDIPVVNNIQAGLMLPDDKNKLDTYPADAADLEVDLGYTPAADKGTVTNTNGDDAEIPLATGTNAGLMAPGDKNKIDGYPATPGDLAATLDLQAVTDNGNTTTNGATFGGDVGIGADLDVSGKTILRNALGVGLPEDFGTAGQVLVSNGAFAAPSWGGFSAPVFGWDHNDDTYGLYLPGTSIKVSDLTGAVDIDVQSRIRRCVINDSGVVQYYLDADDSDLKSGDWLRIVETEALNTAYTGTISESTNSLLRVGVPAWAAGTFTLGQRVTHGGSLWECIAATTTATPAAGTVSSVLDGTDGQVVVEVPAFSVRYGFLNGVHTREVRLGYSDSLIAQGFQPHPAFVKKDGTYKNAFYIGAYHTYDDAGTGSSVSGQINTRSQTRATFRTEAEARGAGWHVLSYLEMAAIQTLLVCEFRDYNSQKVIGNGSDAGTTYGVTTGQSDDDGNHSVNSTDNADDADDYMAYRGIENLYGRAWQWVDGINVYERVVYLTNDQTAFADDTADGHEFYAQVPSGSSSYQKELHPLADVFLPSVVTGASATTYLGDALWTSTGWRVASVGGRSDYGAPVGAFCLALSFASGDTGTDNGARLAYAAN